MSHADRPDAPKRKLPVGSIAAWMITAGLVATGGYGLVDAHRADRKVDLAAEAEPLRMKVDLSRPGQYEGTYRQTYMGAHGAGLAIHLGPVGPGPAGRTQPGSSPAAEPTPQLASGFAGEIEIFDSAGKGVFDTDLTADDLGFLLVRPGKPRPEWPRFRLPASLPLGTYRFVLDVRQPAGELAGREQTATARYMLCGLERFPASLIRIFSGVLVFLGMTVGMAMITMAIRRRKTNA